MNPHNASSIRRPAIIIPTELDKKTILLNSLSNEDITTIQCEINKKNKIILSSIYMDREKEIPIKLLNKIVAHAKEKNFPLVIGTDSNAHSNNIHYVGLTSIPCSYQLTTYQLRYHTTYCIHELNKASANNNINLLKVPAHTGIQGNE